MKIEFPEDFFKHLSGAWDDLETRSDLWRVVNTVVTQQQNNKVEVSLPFVPSWNPCPVASQCSSAGRAKRRLNFLMEE